MALKISRILHAGYLLESAGTRVLFDPLFETPFSRNCFAFPKVEFSLEELRRERFDAVFISHYHDDHLSLESLDLIDRATPIFLFCIHEEMFSLLRELGFERVHSLELKNPVSVGEITVTAHPALDRDVDSIFEIESNGLRVLNVVDSWIDPETFQILKTKSWDLILWPFQTMRELEVLSPNEALRAPPEIPHELLAQLGQFEVKNIVASSCQFRFEDWSWLNRSFFPISYRLFERAVAQVAPKSHVFRMNPGQSFELSRDSLVPVGRLNWVMPIGDQNLDYDFDKNTTPSLTSDIAQRFPALSAEENEFLADFLAKGIFEKYYRLDPPETSWFAHPRPWCLEVYDHLGQVTNHFFEVDQKSLAGYHGPRVTVNWRTQVIARKLVDALVSGESMTSMYLRIFHDGPDILEDPLLRVLFGGQIGSYQRAQLKKLTQRSRTL